MPLISLICAVLFLLLVGLATHLGWMKPYESFTVIAVVTGPILAVQAQKWVERIRSNTDRRMHVFKQLMATRAAILSSAHVEALNRIDLEFCDKAPKSKDAKVRVAWRAYLHHLNLPFIDPAEQARVEVWKSTAENLLNALLVEMGKAVGYNFSDVDIRSGSYYPRGLTTMDLEHQAIRRFLVELLHGDRTLPMSVKEMPYSQEAADDQKKVNAALLKHLGGETVISVKVVEGPGHKEANG